MISLFSFLTLVPLAISAARVPYTLLDTSIVTDTTSDLNLHLEPRSSVPDSYNLTHLLHEASLNKRGGVVDSLLPDIQLGTSFCLTLAVDLRIVRSGSRDDLVFAAGTCLCVDAEVATGSLSADVTITSSTGVVVRNRLAENIRNAVSFDRLCLGKSLIHQQMLSAKYGLNLDTNIFIDARAQICLQLELFVRHTQHDFSNPSAVNGCCARSTCALYPTGL